VKRKRGDEEGASELPAFNTHTREKIIAFLVQEKMHAKFPRPDQKAKLRDLLRTIGVFYTSSQYHLSGMKKKYVS